MPYDIYLQFILLNPTHVVTNTIMAAHPCGKSLILP